MLKGAGHKNPCQSLFIRSQIIWKREHSSPWLNIPALVAVDSKAAWHKNICLHIQKYIFTFYSKFTLNVKAFLSIHSHNFSHLYFVKQAVDHRKSKRWSFISENYLEIQLNTSRVPLKINNTWFWMPPILSMLEYGIWIIYMPADFPDSMSLTDMGKDWQTATHNSKYEIMIWKVHPHSYSHLRYFTVLLRKVEKFCFLF